MSYPETTLRTALDAARARILARAAAGPDAVRDLISGAAGVTAAVDLRTGEALAARVSLAEGAVRVWYDTRTGRLHGVAGTCYGTLPLGDGEAAALVGDAVWRQDTSPKARDAA